MATTTEQWQTRWFPSGTMIVEDVAAPLEAFEFGVKNTTPHLYVYGPGYGTEGQEDGRIRDRYQCCEDLAAYLNGGDRPKWLDDLRRVSETHAEDVDGTSVTATGPMIDRDPPKCDWINDPSQEAQDARARLMDRLQIPSGKATT